MKSGQGHGSAKKKFAAGRGAGIVTGIVLVAVLMPFPLAAAVDRTEGIERAGIATIRDVFSMTAAMQFLVAQARDTEPPKIPQAAPGDAPRKPAADAAPAPNDASQGWGPTELGVGDRIQDWLARANREFQTTIIRRLSTPPSGGVNNDEIARKLEEVKKQEPLAAAAKRADDERKAAEAERAKQAQAEQAKQAQLAEQAQRQAAEAKRLQEAREAADKAAQKAAEEASRKAAAEDAHKTAEQAKIPQQQQQPPPAPQAAAKPEDSARLAQEMRQERARLEAEANDIEAQRKAAEAKRSADERAQDEARVAEDRRRAAAADSDKNRTRKIVLSTEPIPRADRRSVDAVRQPPPEVRGVYRAPTNVSAAGPVVRRWIWRAGNSRCSRAGRRVMLPGRYTVRAGDSLWRISRRHYHSGLLYAKIYRANRSVLRNPDLIYPCQSIFVPRRH